MKTTVLQLVGVAAFCAGTYMIAVWLGLMITGLAIVAIGHLLDKGADS